MELDHRKKSFSALHSKLERLSISDKNELFHKAYIHNPWFTFDNLELAWKGILELLEPQKVAAWLDQYDATRSDAKNVGVIMAGNIPMVGFHDFLCVLLSGNKLQAKLSSQDKYLIPFIAECLIDIEPRWESYIEFTDNMKGVDALIATGSDNSARYFHYYFKDIPHIIRQNRTSVSIVDDNTTTDQLEGLGDDIFTYFGMGCRNVSHIFLPKGYDLGKLDSAWKKWQDLMDHHKYANNYFYNKSILQVRQAPYFDFGYVLLEENKDWVSPTSLLYLEFYDKLPEVKQRINQNENKTQCTVANPEVFDRAVPYGKAQFPQVDDYADNVDTMAFLTNI